MALRRMASGCLRPAVLRHGTQSFGRLSALADLRTGAAECKQLQPSRSLSSLLFTGQHGRQHQPIVRSLLRASPSGVRSRGLASTTNVPPERIRNIAIIAHVDHGKTTLVDALLKHSRTKNMEGDRVMDSNALERERGITILAKCTSLTWTDARTNEEYHINIVDTPGHADFGGEVERIMSMVDGVALVCDATDGPMTQTKFVLSKALKRGLKPIVVINKVDRPSARLGDVESEILDLFCSLNASEEQLEFPILYASGRDGWAVLDAEAVKAQGPKDLTPFFETVVTHVKAPSAKPDEPFSLLVTQIERHKVFGKCLTGKIQTGVVKAGDLMQALDPEGKVVESVRVLKILARRGLEQIAVDEATAGDIVSIAGFSQATVNSTLCDPKINEPLPSTPIDPPTLSMTFAPNDSPFAGQEGSAVTFNQLRDRLRTEAESNVSITVNPVVGRDVIEVCGRGELQLGVLIEEMRREGLEFSVYPPKVVFKREGNDVFEPVEELVIDVDAETANVIIQKLLARKADMAEYTVSGDRAKLIFQIPTRGLLGFRPEFTNDTKGEGIMNQIFHSWVPHQGDIQRSDRGAIISEAEGMTTTHALWGLEPRGQLFVHPNTRVYPGMIIGEHAKGSDLEVNPVKTKQLSNVRSVTKDEKQRLSPPRSFSIEEAISYVGDDEIIEVTPKSVRLRKRMLDKNDRARERRQKAKGLVTDADDI